MALVIGREETLRAAAVAELRAGALGPAASDFDEDRFDFAVGGLVAADVVAAALTHPVLAPRRFVRVRGLDDRRARVFLDEALPRYLEDPPPTTCLVLEMQTVDRRQRWVKLVEKAGALVDVSGPRRPADVRRWIEQRFARAGKRAAAGTAATLFELVGPDLDRLASEVEKASLHCGERDEVTPEDVAAVACALRPRAVYELAEAVGTRALPQALRVLARLLDQGEPSLAVLAGLASHFRRLVRARELRPADSQELASALGLHPYAAQKLAEQLEQFDPSRLRRCLEAVHRADEELKGGSPLPPRLTLERLVLAVAR